MAESVVAVLSVKTSVDRAILTRTHPQNRSIEMCGGARKIKLINCEFFLVDSGFFLADCASDLLLERSSHKIAV